ncbi:proton-coupled folate transporter-like [Branchiostoma floridae]|uniref:Proton-coupled folate transporter-like n=1 Tax=Branchiostoma floridae TaxID=7739 RepID=A0A9J7ND19_BRAFL|nr:proton-coupled folate transporter-like [Branchiostoma floridae]
MPNYMQIRQSALLYGMHGSSTTLYGGCFAYLTDITEPGSPRTFRMAILESAIGVSAIVGVLAGNLWLGVLGVPLGFQEPFWFTVGLTAFSLLYAIFGIKETCLRRGGQKVCSLGNVSGMVQLVRGSFKTGQWKLGVILLVFFLNNGVFATWPGIVTLTVVGPPYCWTPDLLGYFYAAMCAGFVLGVLGIKLLGKCLSPYGLMHVGFVSGTAGFVVQGLAVYTPNRNAAFYLGLLVY